MGKIFRFLLFISLICPFIFLRTVYEGKNLWLCGTDRKFKLVMLVSQTATEPRFHIINALIYNRLVALDNCSSCNDGTNSCVHEKRG